jgi:hypothetical protein
MDPYAELGNLLGGGGAAETQMSFYKGQQIGAQTQKALADARARVAQNRATDMLGDSVANFAADDAAIQSEGLAGLLAAGIDPSQLGKAMLQRQEQGFRAQAGDPNVDFETANKILRGLANGPVNRFDTLGEGMYQDRFSNDDPVVSRLGEALIGQRAASAEKDRASALLESEKRTNPEKFRSAADKVVFVGGVPYSQADLLGRGPPGAAQPAPLVTPGTVGDNAGTLARAKQYGKMTADQEARAPQDIADIDRLSGDIARLLAEPGFDILYGKSGVLGPVVTSPLVSQQGADASAVLQNVDAQAYTTSIQAFRGLGALSNLEGQAAQRAFTYANNRNLSDEAARAAWQEVLGRLAIARRRAEQRITVSADAPDEYASGGAPQSPAAPASTGWGKATVVTP